MGNPRTRLPFPLPDVALVSISHEDGVDVELIIQADKYFWEGKLKGSTPHWVRAELLGFIAIQRERKRLGLDYLTFTDAVRAPK